MDDPFLNYFALGVLIFVVVVLFYGVIAIHDIPHLMAKSRNHPHQDAIHAAGWVSLFTLHVLWPFLWIWAMAYRPDRGWGISSSTSASTGPGATELAELRLRIAKLEAEREPKAERRVEIQNPAEGKLRSVGTNEGGGVRWNSCSS
jgi:hypothetical protein